ncbi:MAG: YCF48-related protein [Ignavibacteriae bacterium]|nr:YCF48-related protein [Ignavibacteriota bacterium]
MKKIFLVIVFYYSLFITNYSLSQWVWQSPAPQGNNLYKTTFINKNTGWMAGGYGTLLKTTNSGVNWIIVCTGSDKNFADVKFIDEYTGYTGGGNYEQSFYILKTTNGGINWITKFEGTQNDFEELFFINSNTGWFMGNKSGDVNVYRTTNGGANWTDLNYTSNIWLRSIVFINEKTGIIAGESGYIAKTTNGGFNWTTVANNRFGVIYSLYFLDNNTGYGSTIFANNVIKTTNGGDNWFDLTCPANISGLYDVKFFNQNTGIATGCGGAIIKTTNSGANWNIITVQPNVSYPCYNSVETKSDYAWIGGSSGEILRSTDYGSSWIKYDTITQTNFNGITFINENTGFVVGGDYTILKTTNSGNNWQRRNVNNVKGLMCTYFLNSNTGWAAGGGIIKTTDGGSNWATQIDISPTFYIRSIIFVNENTGIAAGGSSPYGGGYILRTTNGGTNWSSNYSDKLSSRNYYSVFFVNNSTGWIVGTCNESSNGIIMKTTDTGLNWIEQNSNVQVFLSSVYFINENTGWIGGDGKILKTTNGGQNWLVNLGGTITLYSIKFFDLNTGYGTGWSSLGKTTNGGLNWTFFPYLQGANTQNAFFINQNTGWIIGYNGAILKTTNGGNVFVKKVSKEIPTSFMLYQNYPNPFNPNTIIRFQIKDLRFVTLKVYDILGKEIITLVNEKQSPGVYEVTFDGSMLPSGVYFYKLSSVDFSEVKKMILIK